MDELEFRRAIYGDPNCNDESVLAAVKLDPKKQAFQSELKRLDQKMKAASEVSVPDDLAHKLLLRQSINTHQKSRNKTRVLWSLAASMVLAIGLSFSLWQQGQNLNLAEHALAHVYHEGDYALAAQEDISLQQVNAKLARFGAHLGSEIGRIYYANFCNFQNVESLHLVMQGKNGRVSVFVTPEGYKLQGSKSFVDARFTGTAMDYSQASLILIGEKSGDVDSLKAQLQQTILFSA